MGLLLDKDNQMCFLVGMYIFIFFFFKIFLIYQDYIAGGTLKNLIHDLSIPLTWLQRLRYAKDIAAGMVKQKLRYFYLYYLYIFLKGIFAFM